MKEAKRKIVFSDYLESLEARVGRSLEEAADDAGHTGHALEIFLVAMIVWSFYYLYIM